MKSSYQRGSLRYASAKPKASSVTVSAPKSSSVWSYVLIIFGLIVISAMIFFFETDPSGFSSVTSNLRNRIGVVPTISDTAKPIDVIPSTVTVAPVKDNSVEENNSNSNSNNNNNNNILPNKQIQQNKQAMPEPQSKYAYVTLISGIDNSFRYRGFLYNCLIMRRALRDAGSTADFIALIGYSDSNIAAYQDDMQLLKDDGIILYVLPRLIDPSHKLNFAEMALLKITPYSFTQYERIQFFDGDIMPLKNMDCFFQLNMNTYTVGLVSPVNSGWYLALPNIDDYNYMKAKAIWRLGRDWDKINGWAEVMPPNMTLRGGKVCNKWEFNGADMDQGLFTHRFVINQGNAMLIDTELRKVRVFNKGILHEPDTEKTLKETIGCCNSEVPTGFFVHFTGRSKPWMVEENKREGRGTSVYTNMWMKLLDSLNLEINSSNIGSLGLGSPLGFWNAGFPKGGYKTDKK